MILLAWQWSTYVRPFNGTLQESLASFHTYGFALSNRVLDGHNPFIARELNCYLGETREYNHWPNGFFAFFNAVIWAFGPSQLVGRLTALAFSLLGLMALVAALYRRYPFIAFVLPLTVASSLGRDSLSFVFIDAVMLPVIGVAWLLAVRRQANDGYSWPLRALVFGAPFFLHLTSVFTIFVIIWAFCVDRRLTRGLGDVAAWLLGLVLTLFALSWTTEGISAGAQKLFSRYLHRASLDPGDSEFVGWGDLLSSVTVTIHQNVFFAAPWRSVLWMALVLAVAFTWLALRSRPTLLLTATMVASVVVYCILLRNYVGVHLFARLPVTVLLTSVGLIILSTWITPSAEQAWKPLTSERPSPVRLMTGYLVATLSMGALVAEPRSYMTDDDVVRMSMELERILQSKDLTSFTAFQDTDHAIVDPKELFPRMCQFYFGEQIVHSINEELPQHVFPVELSRP